MHTAVQLRLLAQSVCLQAAVSTQTMLACMHIGGTSWYQKNDFTGAEKKENLKVKMPGFLKIHFIAVKPQEILSTDKRALRRYNHGNALILSKCSLIESLLFFCGPLLSGSSVRISQVFTPGLWCSINMVMYGRARNGRLCVKDNYLLLIPMCNTWGNILCQWWGEMFSIFQIFNIILRYTCFFFNIRGCFSPQ